RCGGAPEPERRRAMAKRGVLLALAAGVVLAGVQGCCQFCPRPSGPPGPAAVAPIGLPPAGALPAVPPPAPAAFPQPMPSAPPPPPAPVSPEVRSFGPAAIP